MEHDALRQRAEAMRDWCVAYSGPDKLGALAGELDCLIELQLLEEAGGRNFTGPVGDEGRVSE